MVPAISVYSASVPYAARFTAAVKIPLVYDKGGTVEVYGEYF